MRAIAWAVAVCEQVRCKHLRVQSPEYKQHRHRNREFLNLALESLGVRELNVLPSGDPRMGVDEALDWIEMIPFTETRNYVQRVLENITVYRERLTEKPTLLSFNSLTAPVAPNDLWTSPPRAPRRPKSEG